MRLEVGTFPVRDVVVGKRMAWDDGVLEIDVNELLDLVVQDPIEKAKIEVVKPGESARIINYEDVLEPKVKVSGGGTVYPGVCGRPTDSVGEGRSHRLGSVGVVQCLDTANVEASVADSRLWGRGGEKEVRVNSRFIDMSGEKTEIPAATPYAQLFNICVSVEAPTSVAFEEQSRAAASATHRVADRLAEIVKDLEPPDVEVFDFEPKDDLPGVVYIPHLASAEPQSGARGTYGTAVYGQTRLSAPWLLSPTEMMDGAVGGGGASWGGATWILANHPVVMNLAERHGKDVNFLGCIVQRTNWTNQGEYTLVADRAAWTAKMIGAKSAIITTDVRGQRWVGTMLTLAACERSGINTVLLTEEEDNENGNSPPLLFSPPELRGTVSNGTGDVPEPFSPVSRVVGTVEAAPQEWYGELPAVHGAYGAGVVYRDFYGFGRQSYADF
jgi:hypothetical protein